jgi:DNA-binding response OmpR family regulator
VRYDRAGVGLSDRERGPVSLDEEHDLLVRVIDRLGAERVHLLGISCGGPVGVSFAARHPDRVDRMALYGSYLDGQQVGAPDVRDAMIGLVRAHWGLGSTTLMDVFLPGSDRAAIDRYVKRQQVSADAETAACLLGLTYELDARDLASRVRAPTIVLHRRRDRAIPFEAGRSAAAAIPGAAFVPLEGRAHPPWEEGNLVADIIAAFLETGRIEMPGTASEGGCRFDDASRAVIVDGEAVTLTRLEYGLLRYLRARVGEVVTRDELLREVWEQEFGGSNVVDAAVRAVRRKLGVHAGMIETVKGHGYRFVQLDTPTRRAP